MFLSLLEQFQHWKLASDIPGNVDNNPVSGTHKWVRDASLPDAVICFQCSSSLVSWHKVIPPVRHTWSLKSCYHCWLLLGDLERCFVSPQSPGDHEQMKRVRGSPSKTGCAKRHYYYTLRDKRSLSQPQQGTRFLGEKAVSLQMYPGGTW